MTWFHAFGNFIKNQDLVEIYNAGGGRYSNCSILEAINIIEKIKNIKIKKTILGKNRVGDHIWYISNMKKIWKHYQSGNKYSQQKIIEELIEQFSS